MHTLDPNNSPENYKIKKTFQENLKKNYDHQQFMKKQASSYEKQSSKETEQHRLYRVQNTINRDNYLANEQKKINQMTKA